MLEKAIELDPDYAQAHAWQACTLGQAWGRGFFDDREYVWKRVVDSLQTSLSLDENDSECHRILAAIHIVQNEHDKAWHHQQRALALNPNNDLIVVQNGELLTWFGKPEEGVEWIERAMRLNPYHPERYWSHLGRALYGAGHYPASLAAFKRISALDYTHHAFLAACFAQMGGEADARSSAAEVVRLKPDFSVGTYLDSLPYKNGSDRERHRDGLVKAGLPV